MLVHLSFMHVVCVICVVHSWVHTCVYLCVHMQACVHVHVHMLVYSVFVRTLYGTMSAGSPSQGCWPVTIRTTLQVALQTSDSHDRDLPPCYRHTEEHRDIHKCMCAYTHWQTCTHWNEIQQPHTHTSQASGGLYRHLSPLGISSLCKKQETFTSKSSTTA